MKIQKDIEKNGKTFKFFLTNHIKPDGSTSGYDYALEKIAEEILYNADSMWVNLADPLWYISDEFRICPITKKSPLWNLLDDKLKTENLNWLIFQFHPRVSKTIRVTHFGPFGARNNDSYGDE